MQLEIDTSMNTPLKLSGGCSERKINNATLQGTTAKDHLIQIGSMIEDSTSGFMEKLKQIYVGKMKEILSYLKGSSGGASAQDLMMQAFMETNK